MGCFLFCQIATGGGGLQTGDLAYHGFNLMISASRRSFLGACAVSGASLASSAAAQAASGSTGAFRYCLNSATISGYRLSLAETIDVAAKAGYQGIEPWLSLIHADVDRGASLRDLRARIGDRGLTVEGAIGFDQWLVDDPARRAKGVEQLRRNMDLVAQLGGRRIAAPPAGANRGPEIPLPRIAERYRAVLDLGDRMGVVPELEFWGTSANLHLLAEAVFAAIEADHPKACVLADLFHLYKGGSGFEGLRLLSAQALQVFHMNDYPADPPRATATDRNRVYPGDGIAPMRQILADLRRVNPNLVLSLELFNPAYWKGDPLETARTGLARMQECVRQAAADKTA